MLSRPASPPALVPDTLIPALPSRVTSPRSETSDTVPAPTPTLTSKIWLMLLVTSIDDPSARTTIARPRPQVHRAAGQRDIALAADRGAGDAERRAERLEIGELRATERGKIDIAAGIEEQPRAAFRGDRARLDRERAGHEQRAVILADHALSRLDRDRADA